MTRINKSKTNKTGRREHGIAIRHKNCLVCPINALGFYLFTRFCIRNEPFPNFSTRQSWYDLKLFPHSKSPTTPCSYETQRRVLKESFAACNVRSIKVCHTTRFCAAREAKAGGASEDGIRIHGRWCADRMVERYLSEVSLEPIRILGGFHCKGGDLYLPRDLLTPLESLQKQIFPEVDEWLEKVGVKIIMLSSCNLSSSFADMIMTSSGTFW